MKKVLCFTIIIFLSVFSKLFPKETKDGFLLDDNETYYKQVEQKPPLTRISFIKGVLINKNEVFLTWKKLDTNNVIYTVYRHSYPLDTLSAFSKAQKVAKLIDSDQFLDKTITKSGTYYYAVTTVAQGFSEDKNLVENESYLIKGFTVVAGLPLKEPQTASIGQEYTILSLNAKSNGSTAWLSWNYSGNAGTYNFYLLGFNQKPTLATLQGAKKLGSVDIRDKSLQLLASYPYVALLRYGTKANEVQFIEGQNYISIDTTKNAASTAKPSTKTAPADYTEIDKIVRNMRKTGDYRLIEMQLRSILKKTSSPTIKARCYFFLGRIRAENKEYKQALKYLYRSDVQSYFPNDAKFWQDYCLMRLKN